MFDSIIKSQNDFKIKDTDIIMRDELKFISVILENNSIHLKHIPYSLEMKDQLKKDAKKDLDLFLELK